MAGTTAPVKILMVEDSQADAELIVRELRELKRPFEHVRVASGDALRRALAEYSPDVVLSDFSMPGFSGQEALQLVIAHAPHVPLLFVSGTIGEELAIDALKRGAIDYVLKDNLRRLPSAIERALDIVSTRREHARVESALRDSEQRFRSIVENSGDWVWECDLDLNVTYSNGAIARILGYLPEDLLDRPATDFMLAEDGGIVMERMPTLVAEGKGWQNWQLRWRHSNGSIRVLESTAGPYFDEDGTIVGFRGVDHDITAILDQKDRIRHLARIHAVLSALGNVVLRSNTREELMQQACTVAVEQGEFAAACICQLVPGQGMALTHSAGDAGLLGFIAELGNTTEEVGAPAWNRPGVYALRENRKVMIRDYLSDPDIAPQRRAEMARHGIRAQVALPIGSPPWAVIGLYALEPQAFDDEELDLLQSLTDEIDYGVDFIAKGERLEFLAFRNPVSGLYNRTAFRDQLPSLLGTGPLAIAAIDLQRFSYINDSRGRDFGDALLREVGERLLHIVDAGSLVAHPEADTFLLACPAAGNEKDVAARVDAKMQDLEEQPFLVGDEEVHVCLHVGIAFGIAHGENTEAVERNAMAALAEARQLKVRTHAFDESLRGRVARRLELEHDLRHAIEAGEFELHYQPKFDASGQQLTGAEALLRWMHPVSGPISPAEFIPVLEETGRIVAAGRWVMREALATARDWRAYHPTLRIAVNVSARELHHPGFLDGCRALLEPYVDDQLLDIEITESLLMDDIGHCMQLLDGLRELGCRIAIDDFGTGYSSLNYLARLPVDTIKIDQSFVSGLAQSPETMGLVTNIINLAHSLSLDTVAEGVEEEEQMKLLRLLRCDQLQGYLLGRPVPAAEFARLYLGIMASDVGA